MTSVLVPLAARSDSADVWVGRVAEDPVPRGLVLEVGARRFPLDDAWTARPSAPWRVDHQQLTIDDLEPGRRYGLSLMDAAGNSLATGSVTTLPTQLPTITERPLVALLGSCFSVSQDSAGRVGRAFEMLPSQARPDVKFLCGDQVYLDAPWTHFLWHTHEATDLDAEFVGTYRRSWGQLGTASGFQRLLSNGATYFTSDDHDFWNNAPNPAAYARDTWSEEGRTRWLNSARDLFDVFQSKDRVQRFAVGSLSFCVADTRFDRQSDRSTFVPASTLTDLEQWVSGLDGPGVLVIGQSVFATKAGLWGLKGFVTDFSLPDFAQYADFVRLLMRSQHSLVILTGDVHFGRVASCRLPSGAELVEVVSSPMSLVDPAAKGHQVDAPDHFPAFAVPGVSRVPTSTRPFEAYVGTDNHFATLEFAQKGSRVGMTVKVWPIGAEHPLPVSRVVDQRWLH